MATKANKGSERGLALPRPYTTITTTTAAATTLASSSLSATSSIPRKYSFTSRPRARRRNSSHSSTDFAPSDSPQHQHQHQPRHQQQQQQQAAAAQSDSPNGVTTHSGTTTPRRRPTATVPIPSPRAVFDSEFRPPTSSSTLSQTRSPREFSDSASYFTLRSNPSGTELRSPLPKRPPASRSSHGIETASGPPPALSTQRSFSIDSWRYIAAEATSPLSPELGPRQFPRVDVPSEEAEGGIDALIGNRSNRYVPSDEDIIEIHDPDTVPDTSDTQDDDDADDENENENENENETNHAAMTSAASTHSRLEIESNISSKRRSNTFSGIRHVSTASQSSNEDLFFDIANGDDTVDTVTESKPNRNSIVSRTSSHKHTKSQPNARLPVSQQLKNGELIRSSPMTQERRGSFRSSEVNESTTPSDRTTARDRSFVPTTHLLDARPLEQRLKSRLSGSSNPRPILAPTRNFSTRERSPESPSYVARRQSVTETQNYRLRNQLQYGANGLYGSSPLTGRIEQYSQEPSPPAARDGTESSVSTTAPSTVWDELDDLKSRIRKLELTGKLPGSSGAAIAERPRTATTTVTTMSSSPKRTQYSNTSPTFSSDVDAETLHPLLRSALVKSQPLLAADVFRALETTASDALTIASMITNVVTNNTHSATDRQLRRKADSMCRSLTELCIALSESKPLSAPAAVGDSSTPTEKPSSTIRPTSRDASRSRPRSIILDGSATRYQRAASLDPEPNSARVLSRLEARRMSLMSGSTVQPSPIQDQNNTATLRPGSNSNSNSSDGPSRAERETAPSTTRDRGREREPPTPTQSTLNRTSTVLSRFRNANGNDTAGEDSDASNTPFSPNVNTNARPHSRARTELGRRSQSGAAAASSGGVSLADKRKSREYTSNYPLPAEQILESRKPESWITRGEGKKGYVLNGGGSGAASAGASPAYRERSLLNGTSANGSAANEQHLSGLPQKSATQPSTPTIRAVGGNAADANGSGSRLARRGYLDRSADSTRAIVGDTPQSPVVVSNGGTPAENRQKRLSSLGLGGLMGRRARERENERERNKGRMGFN